MKPTLAAPCEIKQVFRLSTDCYFRDHGKLVITKVLRRLKRKSAGDYYFEEDIEIAGAAEVAETITNLFSVPDGVYELQFCNMK